MREEVGAEQEAADGAEGAHGVHDADVHAAVVALHVVVHVRRAKGEERRPAAPQQELEKGRIRVRNEKLDLEKRRNLTVIQFSRLGRFGAKVRHEPKEPAILVLYLVRRYNSRNGSFTWFGEPFHPQKIRYN